MPPGAAPHKDSRHIYRFGSIARGSRAQRGKEMAGVALILFIGLFAFGGRLMGWSDHSGQIQMGLFMAFLFGIVSGYGTRGS